MPTLRDIADGKVVWAYGTSEGVQKAWDTRGRGRKEEEEIIRRLRRDWGIAESDKGSLDVGKLDKDAKKEGEDLLRDHKELKDKVNHLTHKLEDPDKVAHLWARIAHFIKNLMDWHEAFGEIPKALAEGWIAMQVYQAHPVLAQTISGVQHIFHHIAPVISNIPHLMGPSGLFAEREFNGQSANLRAMVDGRVMWAYGTSEGVTKAWDTRGRGQAEKPTGPQEYVTCTGPNCGSEQPLPKDQFPHLDRIEFMMTSDHGNVNPKFDKETMRRALKMALQQLDQEDVSVNYLNTPMGQSSDHEVAMKFKRFSQEGVRPY